MRGARTSLLAVLCVCLFSVAAWAQGYTATAVTGQWHTPPSSKTALGLGSHSATTITLPFDVLYFGGTYTTANVGDAGFMQISPSNRNTNGQAGSFPVNYDGMISVAHYYHMHAGGGSQVNTHTTGTAPNRIFHVTWEGVGSPGIFAQIQLYETTGRIVFAYTTGGDWSRANPYYLGIQGVGTDRRFVLADGNNSGRNTAPSSDFRFDPVVTSFTGRLLTTKLVVDETGIGNSVAGSQPAGGAQLELINQTGGGVVGIGTTNADGTFSVSGLALDSTQSGKLRVSAQGQSAILRANAAATPISLDLPGTVSYSSSQSVGTITLDDSSDPSGTMRPAINILSAIQQVYEFADARTADAIRRLDVYYDPASSLGTSYFAGGGTTPPNLVVASSSATNPDQWDDDVIARAYMLHVFQAITGVTVQPSSFGYDQQLTDAEAMALGFGFAVRTAIKGSSTLYDGRSSSTAVATDIEADEPSAARAPTVPGWWALALHDLVDGDNETYDWTNGTGTDAGLALAALDTLATDTLGAQELFEAYVAMGGDGPGAVRTFIHNGLLPDDRFESNDTRAEARDVGSVALIQRDLVLNMDNEDWYRVTAPTAVTALNFDAIFDPSAYYTQVEMEVFDDSGQRIGTGTPFQPGGPVRFVSGSLPAGTYVARVAHVGGAVLPAYTFQAYESLEIARETMPSWTIDIAYNELFDVRGGIPGYTLRPLIDNSLPPGLTSTSLNAISRLVGLPSRTGTYNFTLSVTDSADPPNVVRRSFEMTINEHLALGIQDFTPLALGLTDGFVFARSGGTAPFTVSATADGELPGGLTMSSTDLRLLGVPDAVGSAGVEVAAVDLAGDDASRFTTVVVCAPYAGKNTTVALPEGDKVSGFYVDAIKGTVLSAALKTGKKMPKRVLGFALVDATGALVAGGKVTTGKSGKAGVKKLVAPESGRYFALCSSTTGPDTELVASVASAAPKKLKGIVEDLDPSEISEVRFGALAGATFKFVGKPAKGSDVAGARVQALVDPDGTFISGLTLDVTEKGAALTVSGRCDLSGTYSLRISAKQGQPGDLQYTMSLAQPTGVTYSAD